MHVRVDQSRHQRAIAKINYLKRPAGRFTDEPASTIRSPSTRTSPGLHDAPGLHVQQTGSMQHNWVRRRCRRSSLRSSEPVQKRH